MADARVSRSGASLAGGLVLPAILLAAASALGWWAWNGGGVLGCVAWVAAGAALVLAGISLFGAFALSGQGKCPSCGADLDGLVMTATPQLVCCGKCGAFARVRDRAVEPVASDCVDAHHVFGARVLAPSAIHFDGCAACGAPATRTHELVVASSEAAANVGASAIGLALTATSGSGFVRAESGVTYEVSVPYCDAHDDAIRARTRDGELYLCFRSQARLRAFCRDSGAVPGVAPPPAGNGIDPS